jgi:hypothetical protein
LHSAPSDDAEPGPEGHAVDLSNLCATPDDDAFISDQLLSFLLQNTLRVALRRFVRAELSRGQYTLFPSGRQSLVYG